MCEEFEVISHGNMDYNIFLNNLLYRTPHVHKEFEVCLLLDGSVQLLSRSSSCAFSAGSLWVINPFESHELIAERPALILSLQIAPAFFSGIFPQMENIEFSLSPAAGGDEISPLAASLLEIARIYFSQEEYASLRCAGLICLFFEQLLEAAPTRCISEKERQSSANRAQRIRTISAYIDRHYSEKLLLTDLARELGLTMGYLSAFFKSAFGLPFQSYVRKLRCEKARQLLLCTNLSLLDIRYQAGPDCKVPFGSYIVPFVIMSMVQSGVIEVPVPGYKLCTRASKPPSQHCAVKLSKCLIRLRQTHCLDRRCMFQMAHIFQNRSGHIRNLDTCLFSFRRVHLLLTVENIALSIDPA